jgi:pantothenate kinase type III
MKMKKIKAVPKYIVERIKKLDNIKVVLTGGLADLIKDVLTIKFVHEPNILIEGLINLYYKNVK